MSTKAELVAEIARLQLLLIQTRRLLTQTRLRLERIATLADAERIEHPASLDSRPSVTLAGPGVTAPGPASSRGPRLAL